MRKQPLISLIILFLLTVAAGCQSDIELAPGADLQSHNLRGQDLQQVDLTEANLANANLKRADLSGATLSKANLNGADLRGAELKGADLSGANLQGANLEDVDLTDAMLAWADLSDVSGLTQSMLDKTATFDNARFQSMAFLQERMAEVCDGIGVPEAERYIAGTGPHPIVMIPLNSEGQWHDTLPLPEYWLPRDVYNTKLVACYTEYGDPTAAVSVNDDDANVTFVPYQIDLTLFKAQTGEIVTQITLPGNDIDYIMFWLQAFVEPPG